MPYTMNEKDTQDLFKNTSISLVSSDVIVFNSLIIIIIMILVFQKEGWFPNSILSPPLPLYPLDQINCCKYVSHTL